jgi:hypothetical protein
MNAFEWESTYVDGSGRVAVDLHNQMTSREFPSPLQFEDLWERRQQTVLLGTKVPTLSLEDTLLMLAVQISKDAGSRHFQLAKLCDMTALLRAYPDLDLTGVLSHAKELGGERMVQFSLCLAHKLLGTPLPQEILGEVRAQPVIDRLVEFTRLQLFDDRDPIARDHGLSENDYGISSTPTTSVMCTLPLLPVASTNSSCLCHMALHFSTMASAPYGYCVSTVCFSLEGTSERSCPRMSLSHPSRLIV